MAKSKIVDAPIRVQFTINNQSVTVSDEKVRYLPDRLPVPPPGNNSHQSSVTWREKEGKHHASSHWRNLNKGDMGKGMVDEWLIFDLSSEGASHSNTCSDAECLLTKGNAWGDLWYFPFSRLIFDLSQVAFVAMEPPGSIYRRQCHLFRLDEPEQVRMNLNPFSKQLSNLFPFNLVISLTLVLPFFSFTELLHLSISPQLVLRRANRRGFKSGGTLNVSECHQWPLPPPWSFPSPPLPSLPLPSTDHYLPFLPMAFSSISGILNPLTKYSTNCCLSHSNSRENGPHWVKKMENWLARERLLVHTCYGRKGIWWKGLKWGIERRDHLV